MKNTFYRSEEMNFAEIDKLVQDLKTNFEECVSAAGNANEWELFIVEHLKNQDENGFWGLIDPRSAPSDTRVAWFYVPTYYSTAILMKFYMNDPERAKAIEGFETALAKGLMASTGRSFSGSGYDANAGAIMAMDIFCQAGAARFIEEHEEICPAFKELVEHMVKLYRKAIAEAESKHVWEEDPLPDFKRIVQYFETPEKELIVFVYGTLLQGNSNHENYLSESEFRGEAVLPGYAIYDLGSFPGIKPYPGHKVKGELYRINPATLQRLNQLESEGSLYNLKSVEVEVLDGGKVSVLTYEYNHKVDEGNEMKFTAQPWGLNNKSENQGEYIWYACYGANTNEDYFITRYIMDCKDQTIPERSRQIVLSYELYFANNSSRWDNAGVAFLNPNKDYAANTLGRMYLITEEQFKEINKMEGPGWYNELLDIGAFDGTPIKSFTHSTRYDSNEPGERYLGVIRKGLQQTYGRDVDGATQCRIEIENKEFSVNYSETELEEYLLHLS